MFFRVGLFLVLAGLSLAQKETTDTDERPLGAGGDGADEGPGRCGPCDEAACPSEPPPCRATLVPDRCSCCLVCPRLLGERCGGPGYAEGRCADGYLCAGRSVYEPVRGGRVGQCVCRSLSSVCGTDGAVYQNRCELAMASYDRLDRGESPIEVDETDELCRTVPFITVPPATARLRPATKSELSCEAEGRPVPNIVWSKDGEELPGNHLNIATRKRSGPSKFAMTSWVLMTVNADDAGSYTCTATNSQGEVSVTSTVTVGNDDDDDQKETHGTLGNTIGSSIGSADKNNGLKV